MNSEQKENIRRVYSKAFAILEHRQKEAVLSGDVNTSLQIANNEAIIEHHLRTHYGIEIGIKHRGTDWVMFNRNEQ